MSIPESQLETWSHRGAVATAKKSHESIRNCLNQYDDWPDGASYEVYLQGSYKNNTNIRGDSDVDVVVQLNSTFRSDTSALSANERLLYNSSYSGATYHWQDFRVDVLQALRGYYGLHKALEGKKSVKVETPYLPTDVVVCIQYREYRRFRSTNDQDYVEGMTFYVPAENRWIVNYPKLHYKNGVGKHQGTGNWYKPTVRLFKNARTYLVEHGVMASDLAASYFLECFLYNVPSDNFGTSYQVTVLNVIEWLVEHHDTWDKLVCQNEQLPIFGKAPEQWSEDKAIQFLKNMIALWTNWGR